MWELAPFTPNRIIPVTNTRKNTTDSTTVILLFWPSPFFITLLYHPQCILTWIMTKTVNKRLAMICAKAQLCNNSWLFPWPAMCNPIPVNAVKRSSDIRVQSMIKIRFMELLNLMLVIISFPRLYDRYSHYIDKTYKLYYPGNCDMVNITPI